MISHSPSHSLLALGVLFYVFVLYTDAVSSSSPSKIGNGYKLVSIQESPNGGLLGLLQVKQKTTIYGSDIPTLQLFVKHENEDRLRVHITDAEKQRWEVPYNILPREEPPTLKNALGKSRKVLYGESQISGSELIFSYISDPFSFSVKRKSNGEILFNSKSEESDPFSSLVFKDQYIEISTKLPKEASLYGLGENSQPNGIKIQPNEPYTLYSNDVSALNTNTDLYGSHPVYMDLRNVGGQPLVHSVLLLNSNGMDVFYRGDSLTYKIIGGVLDFYFFRGPTPLSVVDQYTQFVGRPAPMPYWALGFHQCRWGYRNVSMVEEVVDNYRKFELPLDVIWTDDDHMDAKKDFTLNPISFPRPKVLALLDKVHKRGMKYIVLTDPGIGVNNSYGVYKRGMEADVFIKLDGEPYLGQVWPGPVHFPDFLNPTTVSWWKDEITRFLELFPVDGIWIDMNEVSNFCSGKCTIPTTHPCPIFPGWICCLDCKNLTNTKWDDPPYKINTSGLQAPVGFKTIATSALHYNGVPEYDAHSLYGFTHAIATHKALLGITGKRPFVLTRSTFVGSGKYAAHWTGDNKATWDDLRYSISTILNFGIFGIPMVGSDICGFYPQPTEELCNRWIELGAFYPFSRDHANFYSPRQELYVWDTVAKSARNALGMRYKILPYLYTLNYEAHTSGAPIARPIFFSFPNLTEAYGLSTQFLLGSSVMVSPVLRKGASVVKALFPPGTWYNLFDLSQTVISKAGHYLTLDAPLHVINVHVYQNFILPMQQGGLTSRDARETPFSLVVTFPIGATEGEAKGNLFLDDDELPEMKLGNGYSTYIEFYATVSKKTVKVWSEVQEGSFATGKGWVIDKITVLGLNGVGESLAIEVDGTPRSDVSNVEMNSSDHMFTEKLEGDNQKKSMMVEVKGLELPVGKKFAMSWKMGIKG
ncbi:hypothetical protein ACHQM5_005702 [Ranunculus cassubicifolius]